MSHFLAPAEYLPHDKPMLLLEDVISVTESSARCRVTVGHQGVLAPFLDPQGNLPGWYALELMAQTIGVWSGWHRRQSGQDGIELGMVLGTRELNCPEGSLPGGVTLDIEASLLMNDQRFGSFDCGIWAEEICVATGRVNTFQPTSEELASLFTQGDMA